MKLPHTISTRYVLLPSIILLSIICSTFIFWLFYSPEGYKYVFRIHDATLNILYQKKNYYIDGKIIPSQMSIYTRSAADPSRFVVLPTVKKGSPGFYDINVPLITIWLIVSIIFYIFTVVYNIIAMRRKHLCNNCGYPKPIGLTDSDIKICPECGTLI